MSKDHQLSDDTKRVIRSLLLSKTTDGIIGVDELGECLEAFGYEPDQRDIDFLKKHFDDNGDGNLEVDELVNNIDVLNYHCYYGKTLMREFLRIDQDRDGIIRFPEMLRFLTTHEPNPLPAPTARKLLDELARQFDANFDGKFSYAEFVKIYMSDKLPFKEQLGHGEIEDDSVKSNKTSSSTTPRKSSAKKPSQPSIRARGSTTDLPIDRLDRPKTGGVLIPRQKSVPLELASMDRPKTSKMPKASSVSSTSTSSNGGGAFHYYRDDDDENEDDKKTAKKVSVWDRLSQPSARTRPQHASQQKY